MIRPFSRGTQFMDWERHNCGLCNHAYDDDDNPTCPILSALYDALWGDGTITEEMWQRMGGHFWNIPQLGQFCYSWPCVEFRGEGDSEPFEEYAGLLSRPERAERSEG